MRKIITNLDQTEFQHPLDKVTLETLNKVPLLPKVIELVGVPYNTIRRSMLLGGHIKVSPNQMKSIYKMLVESCEILGVEVPDLYINPKSDLNAYTACPDKPIININGFLIDVFEEDEIRFVIGHELTHIKLQHIIYTSLSNLLSQGILDVALSSMPGGGLLSGGANLGLSYALFQWNQSGELSCDRGGLLACQNVDAALRALTKIGGYTNKYNAEFDFDEYMEQARQFEDIGENSLGAVQKVILGYVATTHPFIATRVCELKRFYDNGHYQAILDRTPFVDEVFLQKQAEKQLQKEAANAELKESAGALLSEAKNIGSNLLGRFGGSKK